ncbi:ISL3 family transposase [Patescibacteria group bacterium]|nr:ISL3 family transposase [Patescibacteria group bacterium]
MRDTDLYRYLLGLEEPWSIGRVDLDVAAQRVDVWVEHPRKRKWACPECGKEVPLHDHAEERAWRHLDSCQFQTFLHARPPRVDCPEHGVRQAKLSWAEPHSRFTLLFERFAIDVLKHTNTQAARTILRISWDEAWHLMERAVQRGLDRKPARIVPLLDVDEKSAGKGQQNYVTIVSDLERRTVEEVTIGRSSSSLESYFNGLNEDQLAGIEAVSMDMAKSYIAAVRKKLSDGEEKIVFDRYHIMQHVNKAVDTVRKQEHKALGKDSILTGTKYLWLYAHENLPEKYWSTLQGLRAGDLKTSRAWAIKENIRHLWSYKSLPWAEKFWKKWYFWATHSRLEPVKKAAKTLKEHYYGIMNYFKHRISNGPVEGINSRIETLWKTACGYRNKLRFRTLILFHLGGLDLYPATH